MTQPLPTLPYGSWPSPIQSDWLTRQSVRLGEPQLTADGSYWIESRPQEKGRCVLMFRPLQGEAREVLPAATGVYSRAHEYGGASYLAVDSQQVFYVDASDQRVYSWDGQQARPLTPEGPFRYADFAFDSQRQRLLCVREDHRQSGQEQSGHDQCRHEEASEIVAITAGPDATVGEPQVLVRGHDFFSNPRLSPDGQQLSWLCWDHPAMPWVSSECWLAGLDAEGRPQQARKVAGGQHDDQGESIFQPQWSPAGELFLVSDRNNWWNLYRLGSQSELLPVTQLEAEFATPQWVFGMSTYGFLDRTTLLACCSRDGGWQLVRVDLNSGDCTVLECDYTDLSQICCDPDTGRSLLLAANPASATRLLQLPNGDPARATCLARSSSLAPEPAWVSRPQAITFATGPDRKAQAHGFYYPPCNPSVQPLPGTTPPLIVLCHGGPTGATSTGLNLKIQYWTSRGFAVMDVNYRGSTGYGRHYREQLDGAWGLHDVEDVCAAAQHLVDCGLANPEQLAIKGSSAGGYTVLAALTFADTFKAGASLYGIGDLETLATDTHKFEARYLDTLVGPYPEQRSLYRQRSPIHHADQLNCPVIFFQGLEDKVVPPNQAEAMVAALIAKGVPVAYVPFAGEGHGFRQADSIQRCLEAEWSFYGQVFGFPVPDTIEPVAVKHLSRESSSEGKQP